jgi:hypothetical protein
VITLNSSPEPDAPVMTEAEWRMWLQADAKTQPHILTGCSAWLCAQKVRVSP